MITSVQEQDRMRDVRAQGFSELVGVIERLRADQTIAHLKSKVATATSSAVQDDNPPTDPQSTRCAASHGDHGNGTLRFPTIPNHPHCEENTCGNAQA